MTALPKNDSNSAVINSAEFARKALEIHDTIALSRFSRLHDVLTSSEGVLDYRLRGAYANGKLSLQLSVQGSVQLSCQRCLEPFRFDLDIASSFFIVAEESLIPEAEQESEEDYLVADPQMQVLNLIEDEILLALPLAPRHELEFCNASAGLEELKKPSPFAALQGLKIGKNID